jgi:hypothetical protein
MDFCPARTEVVSSSGIPLTEGGMNPHPPGKNMMIARNADNGTRHRAWKGLFCRWTQRANRFPVRWEKIESGIAPPNSRDGAAIVSWKNKSK